MSDELNDVTNLVTPGMYRHFKGDIYEVLYCGRHSEDLSVLVAYKKDSRIWFRPIKMFKDRMPDGTLRFTPIPSKEEESSYSSQEVSQVVLFDADVVTPPTHSDPEIQGSLGDEEEVIDSKESIDQELSGLEHDPASDQFYHPTLPALSPYYPTEGDYHNAFGPRSKSYEGPTA